MDDDDKVSQVCEDDDDDDPENRYLNNKIAKILLNNNKKNCLRVHLLHLRSTIKTLSLLFASFSKTFKNLSCGSSRAEWCITMHVQHRPLFLGCLSKTQKPNQK